MDETNKSPGLLQVVGSVLAAMFGVQSEKNRERDFTQGKPIHYVVVGLLATIVFVLIVFALVKLVVGLATP